MKTCVIRAILAVACCIMSGAAPRTCDAGLFDWMFPGRTYPYGPYYPGYYNTNYPGYYNSYYGGYGAYGAYNPGGCGQQSSYYSPYATYGTTWRPIPTTTFTPVVTSSATMMQPYSGYTWQAQRVPYVSLQPAIPWVAPTAPAAPAVPPSSCGCAASPYSVGYASPWQSVGATTYSVPAAATIAPTCPTTTPTTVGYATAADFCPSSAAPSSTSYFGGSSYVAPATPTLGTGSGCTTCGSLGAASSPLSSGETATPWEPVASSSVAAPATAPSSSDWAPYTPPATGTSNLPATPADNRPQLDPSLPAIGTSYRGDSYSAQPNWTPGSAAQAPSTYEYRPAQSALPPPVNPGFSRQAPPVPPRDEDMLQASRPTSNPWEAIPIRWPENPPAGSNLHDPRTETTSYRPPSESSYDPLEGNWRAAK